MSMAARLIVALAVVSLTLWPSVVQAQGVDVSTLNSAEDYFSVCRSDGSTFRCVEVLSSVDAIPASPQSQAAIYYFEMDSTTFESRALSCAIDPATVTLRTDGALLREAAVSVTLLPHSPECAGSWGVWSGDPHPIALAMVPTGEHDQQSRGHGATHHQGVEYRYQEAMGFWSGVATGTVGGNAFDAARGTVRTLRRVDLSMAR